MSEVSTVTNENIPNVSEIDAASNAKLKQQYREQYQQLLSQYETAHTDWHNIASNIKTYVGEAVQLAINNRLTDAEVKLNALKEAVEASDPKEDDLKTMTDELKALLSKLTADIAAVPTLATDGADIEALRETWEALSADDKALLGSEFTQAIEAQFSALNAKISELKKAIQEDKEPSIIENLQTEIAELKTQLSTLIDGTTDGSVISLTDRAACLQSLEEAKKYIGDEAYATFKQQLLSTDVSKQISKEDFQAQLDAVVFSAVQKEAQESVEKTEGISKRAAAMNELLNNNIGLKVMQGNNSLLEFKLNAEADKKLREKAEFNPQIKQFHDEGHWQTPDVTRQQEITQELNEEERRRQETAQMR